MQIQRIMRHSAENAVTQELLLDAPNETSGSVEPRSFSAFIAARPKRLRGWSTAQLSPYSMQLDPAMPLDPIAQAAIDIFEVADVGTEYANTNVRARVRSSVLSLSAPETQLLSSLTSSSFGDDAKLSIRLPQGLEDPIVLEIDLRLKLSREPLDVDVLYDGEKSFFVALQTTIPRLVGRVALKYTFSDDPAA